MSIADLANRLRSGELSPREAVEHYLDRIERLDGGVNSFITVLGEEALAQADALVAKGASGDQPLWGVPVGVKDVIDVAGVPTTAGSAVLGRENIPVADAFVVERLRASGAIILGKLNTHEFAYGAMTTSPYPGAAHNPWAPEHICGGSSGGSGACAAADLAAGTLGTDTAGSVRIPACFNGVTGLRPTWGRVSNRGVVPVSWHFDTVGPIARSAEDCALLLAAIAGADPGDPSTADVAVPDYVSGLGGGARGTRIGVVRSLFESDLVDPRVAEALAVALGELRAAGAELTDVRMELLEHFGPIQQCVQFVEATAVHREWLQSRLSDYGEDVRARLLTGLFFPPTVYVLGQRARRLALAAFRDAIDGVDLLVAPASGVLPPRIGEDSVEVPGGGRILYRLTVIPFNSPWSCVGAPAASVPAGFVDGLPVGLSLIGRRFDETTVLHVAHAYQQLTDWHERRPALEAAEVSG